MHALRLGAFSALLGGCVLAAMAQDGAGAHPAEEYVLPLPEPAAAVPAPSMPPDLPLGTAPGPSPVPEPTMVPLDQGLASWYGPRFHRRRTASGERFDMYAFTAAHRTLPFGTRVCVRSELTGRSVEVRINDRGPHLRGRVIDLSSAAADKLGAKGLGVKPVTLWPLAGPDGSCATALPEGDLADER